MDGDLILRLQYYPKPFTCRFNTFPIKIQQPFFAVEEESTLKFTWNSSSCGKGFQIAKAMLKKEQRERTHTS